MKNFVKKSLLLILCLSFFLTSCSLNSGFVDTEGNSDTGGGSSGSSSGDSSSDSSSDSSGNSGTDSSGTGKGDSSSGSTAIEHTISTRTITKDGSSVSFNMVKVDNSYEIADTETTQELFKLVMGFNTSENTSDVKLPVENVSWLSMVVFCNELSKLQNLSPYYSIDSSVFKGDDGNYRIDVYDTIPFKVLNDGKNNGFRLPSLWEWYYAASGADVSKHYNFSGSDDGNKVGWFSDTLEPFAKLNLLYCF